MSFSELDTLEEILDHPMMRGMPPRIVIKRELDGQMFGSGMSSDRIELKWYAVGSCKHCGHEVKVSQVYGYSRNVFDAMKEFGIDAMRAMAADVQSSRRSERSARDQIGRMAREQAAMGEELRSLRMRTPRWLRDWKRRRDRRRR